MEEELLTIKQVSLELGVATSKIRYLCKHRLVPALKHSRAGYRMFARWQVDWLTTLLELQDAGLDIATLQKYTDLCRIGNSTIVERKAILATRKHQLMKEIKAVSQRLQAIEQREEYCESLLKTEQTPDSQWF